MAVYYKFKSAKDFDTIPIDGHFISVLNLKEKIFESKHLGRGTDFDLVVTNAQTNEEYLDEAMLIPKNTSVLIRRVPGRPRMPIVTQPDMPKEEDKPEDNEHPKSSFLGAESTAMKYPEDSEWDEFGNDLYAIPEAVSVQPSIPIMDAPPPSKDDEDNKIKALIDTPALDWQHQASDGFSGGRGFGRGAGGRMMGGRGFGRGGSGFERKTPPPGYVCHRCKVSGHFIQHCPTNGDPNYDVKKVKPPTGIPKSMLMATPDGSYSLPSGAVAVLRPNEAAFEKEIDGLPSTRSVGDLPPELHCPLCKEVMKDAVLTSKCCFKSFCDRCIRDHIISKSACVCGATNILADDLLPNKTLRDTINRILESNNSSTENGGSAFQIQDMESARCPQPRVSSPNMSAASLGEQLPPPRNEETSDIKMTTQGGKVTDAPQQTLEKGKMAKTVDPSEATHESISVKEPASQGSVPLAEEEVQQKASGEAGKKKKKKKPRMAMNAVDMQQQWKASQDLAVENFMMQLGPSAYNPYWTGMQPVMEGYGAPYGAPMPYMNYGLGPLDMPVAGVMPHDPFGAQGYMLPGVPPQRNFAEFGMGMNAAPPIMSREQFEARKADLRRKRENERREIERRGEMREAPRDRPIGGREMTGGIVDASSMKSKSRPTPPPSISDHHHRPRRAERPSPERRPSYDLEPPRPQKRKSEQRDHQEQQQQQQHKPHRRNSSNPLSGEAAPVASGKAAAAEEEDRKQKRSVFSRISFPEEDAPKKRTKLSYSEAAGGDSSASSAHHSYSHRVLSNGYHEDRKSSSSAAANSWPSSSGRSSGRKAAAAAAEYESSDEDRHFKRRPSRESRRDVDCSSSKHR